MTASVLLLAPAIDRPSSGDRFSVRGSFAENAFQVSSAADSGDELALDVFSPIDPSVCYVRSDHDRWHFGIRGLNPDCSVRHMCFLAQWLNQAFEGQNLVEIIIDLDAETVEILF